MAPAKKPTTMPAPVKAEDVPPRIQKCPVPGAVESKPLSMGRYLYFVGEYPQGSGKFAVMPNRPLELVDENAPHYICKNVTPDILASDGVGCVQDDLFMPAGPTVCVVQTTQGWRYLRGSRFVRSNEELPALTPVREDLVVGLKKSK